MKLHLKVLSNKSIDLSIFFCNIMNSFELENYLSCNNEIMLNIHNKNHLEFNFQCYVKKIIIKN